jgi:hypothetical protein
MAQNQLHLMDITELLTDGGGQGVPEVKPCCICTDSFDIKSWGATGDGYTCSQCIDGFVCSDCMLDAAEKGLRIIKCPICRKSIKLSEVPAAPAAPAAPGPALPAAPAAVPAPAAPGAPATITRDGYVQNDECEHTCCKIVNYKFIKRPLILIAATVMCFVVGWLQFAAITGCSIGCVNIKPITVLAIFTLGAITILGLFMCFGIIVLCLGTMLSLGTSRR